jgi:hypothetical protein
MGKESNPVLYNTKLASITTTGRRQFDILGTSYRTIKDAYSKHPQNVANGILQKQVERFGSHLNMSLYFDGPQAVEKPNTAKTREAGRHKALDALSTSMDTFESRMEVVLRIKKHHFITIKKNLASSFYWSLSSRRQFAGVHEKYRLHCYTLQYRGRCCSRLRCPARRHYNLLGCCQGQKTRAVEICVGPR